MFNLLTNNKLNKSFNPPHHLSRSARNLFLFFFLILYPLHFPSNDGSSQGKLGSSDTFVFLSFSTTFWIFFRLGKPKIFITICIPTDGNFPIFENSALSSRRKSDLISPCIFSRIRKLQLYWSTFQKKVSRPTNRLHL